MIARIVARHLPPRLRSPLLRTYKSMRLLRSLDIHSARPRRPYVGRSVVIVGVFRSATGLGRAAELLSRSLEAGGATVHRVDVTARLGVGLLNDRPDVKLPEQCSRLDATDVVLVLNPDNSRVLSAFDRQWLLSCCIVGHWIWELEQIPKIWRRQVPSYDAIWAPTEFVADSIRTALPDFGGPIKVVPYGFERDPFPAASRAQRQAARQRFGIPADTKVLGYAFSAGSCYARKNPEAAIEVFRRSFPDGDRRGMLILRCQDFHDYPAERARLVSCIGDDPRIRLFERTNRIGIVDFYGVIDILVSPARAEGYGLTLAEAAQAGVAVVTNSWRIPAEILAIPDIHPVGYELVPVKDPQGMYEQGPGSRWADPDIAEMAAVVRRLCQLPS